MKVLGPATYFPTWQRDWEPPGNMTLEASGIWLQNLHRTGETVSEEHKQNLVCTRTQEKGAVTPQETDTDLPVSIQESPAEAAACCRVKGTEYNSAGISPFEGGPHYPTTVCPQAKQQVGNLAPPIKKN